MMRTRLDIKYLDQAVKTLLHNPDILSKLLPYYSAPFREANNFFYVSKLNDEIVDLIKNNSDWNPTIPPRTEGRKPLKILRYFFFENYRIWEDGVLLISDVRVSQWSNGTLTYALKDKIEGKYKEYPFTEESLDQLKQDMNLAFYTRCINVNDGDQK